MRAGPTARLPRLDAGLGLAWLTLALLVLGARPASAQADLALDRWLVLRLADAAAAAELVGTPGASDPLRVAPDSVLYPERLRVVGPGRWQLVRRTPDAASGLTAWIDLERDLVDPPAVDAGAEGAAGAGRAPGEPEAASGEAEVGPILAHTYLRSPADRSLRLVFIRPACRPATAWLNGQLLPLAEIAAAGPADGDPGEASATDTVAVRLGAGWNTLLVKLGGAECPARLGARLLPAPLAERPRPDEATGVTGLEELRVQASRPPGVRRSPPAGSVEVKALDAGGPLRWHAEEEELRGALTVPVLAWGRSRTFAVAATPRPPSTPPAVDLTGTWNLRIFAPQGIDDARAEFRMAPDGALTGRIRDTELGGDLRDGRVTGSEFRFTVRFSGGRRALQLIYAGTVAGDSLQGSVSFGEMETFSSRFRGARAEAGEAVAARPEGEPQAEEPQEAQPQPEGGPPAPQPEPEAEPEAEPELPEPRQPPPRRSPAQGQRPGAAQPAPGLDVERELLRQRLLPPPTLRAPAPARVQIRVEAGGERRDTSLQDLVPGRPLAVAVPLPFQALREASLSGSQARVRLDWSSGDLQVRRAVPPAALLYRLHEPVLLRGWQRVGGDPSGGAGQEVGGRTGEAGGRPAGAGGQPAEPQNRTAAGGARRLRGSWRVPEALAGFTLVLRSEAAPGEYRLDGQPLPERQGRRILCSPCRKGARLELEVRTAQAWVGSPAAVILEPGYPAAADNPEAPPAVEWLKALRGDNRGYLKLGARFAGTDDDG